MRRLRSAFTLMEVNLAILIMATGVLGMVSLYSLGFRESLQSRDDVAGTGYADAYLAPLVAGLSATNMVWSKWTSGDNTPPGDGKNMCDSVWPPDGWAAYAQEGQKNEGEKKTLMFQVNRSCNTTADGVFRDLMDKVQSPFQISQPSAKPPFYALVATRRGGTISLAFRASHRLEQLLSQPVFYTEVRFQGDRNQ